MKTQITNQELFTSLFASERIEASVWNSNVRITWFQGDKMVSSRCYTEGEMDDFENNFGFKLTY
jgi:hypothetical protein